MLKNLLIVDRHFMLTYNFFFSSRRRHTRWNCDWSSDVCSSDLLRVPVVNSIVDAQSLLPVQVLADVIRSSQSKSLLLDRILAIEHSSIGDSFGLLTVDDALSVKCDQ